MKSLTWYHLPEDEPYGGAHRAANPEFSAEVRWWHDGLEWEWTLRRKEGVVMRGRAQTMEAAKLAATEAADKLLDALLEQFYEKASTVSYR